MAQNIGKEIPDRGSENCRRSSPRPIVGKLQEELEAESALLRRVEEELGEDYAAVRHSLVARGLIPTLSDQELIGRHLARFDDLPVEKLARIHARFSVSVVRLAELMDEMGIETPPEF